MSDWSIAMLHRYNLNALQAKCIDLAADGKSRKEIALMRHEIDVEPSMLARMRA